MTKSQPLIVALRRLRSEMVSYDRAVAEAAGLNDRDLTVLEILHREGVQTPTALAQRTRTRLATMTGILARLEQGGWIERQTDATDRRSLRVHATSVERFTALYSATVDPLATLVDSWDEEKTNVVLEALAQVTSVIARAADGPTSHSSM